LDDEEIEELSLYGEDLYRRAFFSYYSEVLKAVRDPYELWLNQVSESETTKRRYLQDILQFERFAVENYGLDVKSLPLKWRQAKYNGEAEREKFLDQLNDVLRDYFAFLKGRVTPLSVKRKMSTVMSFLHAFDIPAKPLRIRYPYVVYHNRDITKDELRLIVEASDVRDRAIWLILYESGMRPQTLAKLKWKHVKADFGNVPMRIDLTPDILKCRVSQRWTFIGEDGVKALKTYLASRLPLKDDDFIFTTEKPSNKPLTSQAMSQAFNKIVQKLKLAKSEGKKPKELRLYCLRKAFRKYMASAVDSAYVEFWMGHTSTATHYLSMDVEFHRQLYKKGYENLRLYEPSNITKILEEQRAEIERLRSQLNQMQRQYQEAMQTIELLKKTDLIQFVLEFYQKHPELLKTSEEKRD
jgi:integrase